MEGNSEMMLLMEKWRVEDREKEMRERKREGERKRKEGGMDG